jgi:putative heme-binding domain-containing protein
VAHTNEAVLVHALQLGDRWFGSDEGHVFDSAFATFVKEPVTTRAKIQFALSFGESRDHRAFAALTSFVRRDLSIRWMDAAVLSSLHGRAVDMLGALLRERGGSEPFLPPLAETIAARRNEDELGRTLQLLTAAKPELQASVLLGLAKGRKNAPRKPLQIASTRTSLAALAASPSSEVRAAARTLEDTFLPSVSDDELAAALLPPAEVVSDETFRKFTAALSAPRNFERGHEIFVQACATCHRIANEGQEVGPDLMGQVGMAEESLLQDILTPNARIRPGYETTVVQLRDGAPKGSAIGLLKEDGPTSVTLMSPNGVEEVFLRKDVVGIRRVTGSLMPSVAEALSPADVANLLGWLRSRLATPMPRSGAEEKSK